jgi:hypothetical protein
MSVQLESNQASQTGPSTNRKHKCRLCAGVCHSAASSCSGTSSTVQDNSNLTAAQNSYGQTGASQEQCHLQNHQCIVRGSCFVAMTQQDLSFSHSSFHVQPACTCSKIMEFVDKEQQQQATKKHDNRNYWIEIWHFVSSP